MLPVTRQEWVRIVTQYYKDLLDTELGDEKDDPEARATLLKPYVDWYKEKVDDYIARRTAAGKITGVIKRVLDPIVQAVRPLSQTYSVSVYLTNGYRAWLHTPNMACKSLVSLSTPTLTQAGGLEARLGVRRLNFYRSGRRTRCRSRDHSETSRHCSGKVFQSNQQQVANKINHSFKDIQKRQEGRIQDIIPIAYHLRINESARDGDRRIIGQFLARDISMLTPAIAIYPLFNVVFKQLPLGLALPLNIKRTTCTGRTGQTSRS